MWDAHKVIDSPFHAHAPLKDIPPLLAGAPCCIDPVLRYLPFSRTQIPPEAGPDASAPPVGLHRRRDHRTPVLKALPNSQVQYRVGQAGLRRTLFSEIPVKSDRCIYLWKTCLEIYRGLSVTIHERGVGY